MAKVYIFKKTDKQIPLPKSVPPDARVFRAATDKANQRTIMWRVVAKS